MCTHAIQVKMMALTAFCYTMRDTTDINSIVLTCIICPLIYAHFVKNIDMVLY